MKCEAVTVDRSKQAYRTGAHPCQYSAVPGSRFCRIHQPARLRHICERRIASLRRQLAQALAREQEIDAMENTWPGNPS